MSEPLTLDAPRTASAPRPVRLLVCGNSERGDDAAAIVAVTGLLPELPQSLMSFVDVRWCEQIEIEDVLGVPAEAGCVIVDTVVGIPVGSVATIPLDDLPEHAGVGGPAPRSSHILPIGQVVAIAGILRETPIEGLFVGLGGDAFGFERVLGPEVRESIGAFREAITDALVAVSASRSSRGPEV